MYAYAGETKLEIVLTDNMGKHFVTKVLIFQVRSGFSTGAIVEEQDYSVLSQLIQQSQAAIADANNAAQYALLNVSDTCTTWSGTTTDCQLEGVELYVDGEDGKQYGAPSDSTSSFKIHVVAMRSTGAAKAWDIEGAIRNRVMPVPQIAF